MGAALGGGAAESAFGSDTTNILTKGTIYGIIAFFLVALGLFLLYQSEAADSLKVVDAGELISAEEVEQATETTATVIEDEVAVVEGVDGSETIVEEVVAVVEGADGVEAIVEDVVEVVEDADGTIEAVVESVEVATPVVDVEAPAVESVPASH